MRRSDQPYWKNQNYWICPKHLPSAIISRKIPLCYFSNCLSVRPKAPQPLKSVVVTKDTTTTLCAYEKCKRGADGLRSEKRENSKYCSIQCKNNSAKQTYRAKKKAKPQ